MLPSWNKDIIIIIIIIIIVVVVVLIMSIEQQITNLAKENLKWRPILWQKQNSMWHQMLHVRVVWDIHKIESSD